VHVVHDAEGWNLGRLVRKQTSEANRRGPMRPLSLPSIEIVDGSVSIDDQVGSDRYTLPQQIDSLHIKARFDYEPVHYSVTLEDLRFHGTSPDLTVQQIAGGLAVRDDNFYIDHLSIRTADSAFTVGGVIEQYLRTPVLKLTSQGQASLLEIGRVAPAVAGYALTPVFDVKTSGPIDRLGFDFNVQTPEAGQARGVVTADLRAPDIGVKGQVDLGRLNLAPILKSPEQKSDITGRATIDLTLASDPASAPAVERLRGTYAFSGPRAAALGYEGSNVRVKGAIAGRRITLDGSAAAYGGTGTAAGFIVTPGPRQPFSFDLQGQAADIDLRKLPASTGVPKLATDITATHYHVGGETGHTGTIAGEATLAASEVEGATFAEGTVAEFSTSAGHLTYGGRGSVTNLSLQRVGQAFDIDAIDKPDYDSRINGTFDVTGSGKSLAETKIDATGALSDTDFWGAHFPRLDYEAHLDQEALSATGKGRFEHLDPGRISGKDTVKGAVTGTADATVHFADLSQPVTLDNVGANGTVTLEASKVGDLEIETASVKGAYADRIATLDTLTMTGADLRIKASGQAALDRSSSSNLIYHIEAVDLEALGRLAGQEGIAGSAVLDGTLTGNATSLATTGTMDGSSLGYQDITALDLNSQYTVTVPELTIEDARVKVTSHATFVKVAGQDINEITATTTYADTKLDFDAKVKQHDRDLDAAGDVIFHPDHQEIHLPTLAVRASGIEWRTAPGSAFAIRYGKGRLELDGAKFVSGVQEIDANGAIALKGEPPVGPLTIDARQVDIAEVEKLALEDLGFTGLLNASATINGTIDAPLVSGTATVTGGGFKDYHYDSLTAKVDFDGRTIGVDATLQQSATEAITARGTVPMTLFQRSEAGHVAAHAGDAIDLRITSTPIDLGIVQGFTSAVTKVTGVLRVDLTLTGAGEDPHAEGIVDIADGAFQVPASGVSYSGLTTSIAVSPDAITIPNLVITDEERATLTVNGTLGVHGRQVGAVDLNLSSNNFEILDNELGDLGVETALKVTGELRRPRIEGNIKLQAARLEVDRILALFYDPYSLTSLPDVVSADQSVQSSAGAEDATKQALNSVAAAGVQTGQTAAGAAPQPPGIFAPLQLNVSLRIPENLVLRGRGLRPNGPTSASVGDMNVTVGGNLDITKQPDAPIILLGSIDTVRGTYQFQGRRFDFVRGGTIRFIGEPDINPILDVSATRTIPSTGIEARVHITGTVRKPELSLTSTPPLDESDILSLIVFNRPVNELGSGERASLATTAGGIATGFIAAPLGQSIGKALDLDQFEITTTTDEGALGAGLTVGQQFGDRMFFRLRQQWGERTTTEFMLEYQLTDFLRVQGSGAPESTNAGNRIGQRRVERAGIDVIFFFSY
jgi:autotransporter translocation and assembly factor TamB